MATHRNETRERIRYKAMLAERTNRYQEMANYMNGLVTGWVSPSSELTVEERDLLHEAYEKVICPLRRAWRTVLEAEQDKYARKNGADWVPELRERYRVDLEDQISHVCGEILKLLEEILIPSASSSEPKVFYLTMKGDYYRYLAEFQVGDDREKAAYAAMVAYKTAENIALADLPPIHPTRLALALNFSVFYYQTLNLLEDAYEMATRAFDEAATQSVHARDKGLHYPKTIPISTLLKRNLDLWALGMSMLN